MNPQEQDLLRAQINALIEAGDKVAELLDDYTPRSEPDCEEAAALRQWGRTRDDLQLPAR